MKVLALATIFFVESRAGSGKATQHRLYNTVFSQLNDTHLSLMIRHDMTCMLICCHGFEPRLLRPNDISTPNAPPCLRLQNTEHMDAA